MFLGGSLKSWKMQYCFIYFTFSSHRAGAFCLKTPLQAAPAAGHQRVPGPGWSQAWLESAGARPSRAVTALEINAFCNDIITALVLIFYCLLSPLYEADPAAHISDLDGLQPFLPSLAWLHQAHAKNYHRDQNGE